MATKQGKGFREVGWTKAGKRKQGVEIKGSRESSGPVRGSGDVRKISMFFVIEFVDFWEVRDLYHEFKDLVDIDKVYFLNKRTR